MPRSCPRRVLIAMPMLLMFGSCQRHVPSSTAPALQVDRLSVLRDPAPEGFALADRPRRFEFPQDHGPHPLFRHEWWYFTGQLQGAAGTTFGFELTVFRLALRPEAAVAAAVPGWTARQIYAAHFAITDVERGQFFSSTRYARDALGLAAAAVQPFALRVADWSVTQAPDGGALHWQLEAADEDYQLQLDLSSDQPPVLNGTAGLSRKADAPGAASYYYSMPHLKAVGHIARQGVSMPVSGLAWLDREWGSGALGPDQQGWDWFAFDLGDGSALMFYALRDRDGRRDPHSAGTFVDAEGRATSLANDDVQIEVQRHWTSAHGGRYPAQWNLRVRSLDLQLQVSPLLADQELLTQPRYWEGAVRATGRRGAAAVTAQGYVELVGYAQAQASASSPSASVPPAH